MQIAGSDIDARNYGVQGTREFGIAQSAKMFALLSDGLYKDKITAVIRELSTNAYDSQIEAGHVSTPFHVQLPNAGNANFKVRDFGTGMSVDKLEKLYTTYGKSDRNDSNDFVGGMGLGSKSPFSYTNSFIVTSFYHGMKYLYVAAKDEMGIPQLNKMGEEPTTEPNGVEISFAVKAVDFREFQEKAIKVYTWFRTTPKITGGYDPHSVKVNKPQYVLKGADSEGFWGVTNSNTSRVIMGNIAYNIDPVHFASDAGKYRAWYSNDANLEVKMLQIGLDLEFPIGSISIDASREGLQYTKGVIKALKERLIQVADLVRKDAEKQISGAKTLWDARIAYTKIFHNGNLSRLFESIDITWNGKALSAGYVNLGMFKSAQLSMKEIGTYGNNRRDISHVQPRENVAFLINDMEKGGFTASERYRAEKSLSAVYLVRFMTGDGTDPVAVRKQLVAQLGIDDSEFIYTSSLPKPPRQKGGKRETVFVMDLTSGTDKYVPTKIDFEDGGVYCELNHGYYIGATKQTPYSLRNTLASAAKLGIKLPKELYLIKTVSLKKYKDDADWLDIAEYIKQEMDKLIATPQMQGVIANASFKYTDEYSVLKDVLKHSTVLLPAGHEVTAFSNKVETLNRGQAAVQNTYQNYHTVGNFFGLSLLNQSQLLSIETEFSALKKKYPMLDFLQVLRYNYVKSLATNFVELLLK